MPRQKKLTIKKVKHALKQLRDWLDEEVDDELQKEMILGRIENTLLDAVNERLAEPQQKEEEVTKKKARDAIHHFTPHGEAAKEQAKRGVYVLSKGDARRMDDIRGNV
jgi:CRISPR/Cas system-associated endonuclease Cas1